MNKLPVFNRLSLLAAFLLVATGTLSASSSVFAQTSTAVPAGLVSVPLGPLAEIGVLNSTYGTGMSAAASFMGDNFGIRLAADSAGKSDHVLGALGIAVNNQGYLIVGGSSGKEPLSGFDTQVKGSSAFVRLDLTNLTPAVRKLFIEVINKKADAKTLSVTDVPFTTVSTQDLGSVIRTTTVDGVLRTTFAFTGGSSNSIGLGGEANVGSDGLLTIKLFHVRDDKGGETSSKTHAWASYKQYFPQYNASASVGADTAGRLAISTEKGFQDTGLGINLAGFKNTKGAKDFGVLFGLNYTFGGNTQNLGKRPDSNSMQLAETLKSFSTVSDHAVRNIEGLGKIVKTVETISSEKVNDVEKPKPSPNPNTAPTALSLGVLMSLTADMTASGQAVGKISCVDYAPSGPQNTCTFSGGTSQFAVAADGTVTLIATSVLKSFTAKTLESFLPAGSYSIPVVATDAAGLTYSNTVVVVVGAERPYPKFSINATSLISFCDEETDVGSLQLSYSSNSDGAVTWTSSEPTIVSVSATGLITRVRFGPSVQITANQAATSTYREASSVLTVSCR
jgi:Bacterial Ig-like domain (group 2)